MFEIFRGRESRLYHVPYQSGLRSHRQALKSPLPLAFAIVFSR